MNSEKVSAFFCGFFTAGIIFIITLFAFFAPISTETTREIIHTVQQSTNIVEALKKEHLVIKDVNHGADTGTVEIIVDYDFLYKNSNKK